MPSRAFLSIPRVVELRDKGLTGPEIATALGISLRTVFRYIGLEMEGGGIVAAGPARSARTAAK